MKRLILGATIALTALCSHAKSPELNAADAARLRTMTQDEYVALIHTANACGFKPSPHVAATLLRSPSMPAITAAVARLDGPLPVLDDAACAALGKF